MVMLLVEVFTYYYNRLQSTFNRDFGNLRRSPNVDNHRILHLQIFLITPTSISPTVIGSHLDSLTVPHLWVYSCVVRPS